MTASPPPPRFRSARFLDRLTGSFSPLHLLIITLSLLMTLGAWQFSRHQIERRSAAQFATARDQVVELIHDRMQHYEDGLRAGVAAMETHGNAMTLEEWRVFSRALRIDQKYPGINGIGVIHHVPRAELPRYLATRRAERPDFTVYPAHDFATLLPISFIEPQSINAAAVGLDVAHERNRRTAALASRDSGTARITGPITLVQDAGETPGFLFYAPFYAGHPATTFARQQSFAGAVYAPFVVRKLMDGLLARDRRGIRFSITDGGEVIYDEHSSGDALSDPDPMFAETLTLDLYGRQWTLDMRTNLAFRAANTFPEPTIVLFAGLLIEALIVMLLVTLSRARARAVAYADSVTADLQEERRKLSATNHELEQYAYVASHDLKTPIRGLGGLTEMLREDLKALPNAPGQDPVIAQHLDLIEGQVSRMGALTRGIMDFARIAGTEDAQKSLALTEMAAAMRTDFGLTPEQLCLSGSLSSVCVDPFNLRRVLENLVSNALKYHDGAAPLRIRITANKEGARLTFAVRDNGPGIAAKDHARIFEMFETLQPKDTPDSTGIGLAIVRKIVERHGGTIRLTSSPGHGATFSFDWPAQQPAARPGNRAQAA